MWPHITISRAGYARAPRSFLCIARDLPTIVASRSNISLSFPLASPAATTAQYVGPNDRGCLRSAFVRVAPSSKSATSSLMMATCLGFLSWRWIAR